MDTRWCIVRWIAGDTSRSLISRGGTDAEIGRERYDERSRCAFCGPISYAPTLARESLGMFGFPQRGGIGDILRFDTREEAEAVANESNLAPHISVDVPTQLSNLRFGVRRYNHGNPADRAQVIDGVGWDEAWLHYRANAYETLDNKQLDVEITCRPVLETCERPTAEQSELINATAERIHARPEAAAE